MTYDRSVMRNTREGFSNILDRARTFEFQRVDQSVRNWLIVVGVYEVLLIIAAIVAAVAISGSRPDNWLLLIGVVFLLGLLGVALVPLRGVWLGKYFARRVYGF